jgi:hypothetical protein
MQRSFVPFVLEATSALIDVWARKRNRHSDIAPPRPYPFFVPSAPTPSRGRPVLPPLLSIEPLRRIAITIY